MKYQKLLFVLVLTCCNLAAFQYYNHYKDSLSGGDSWGYYSHLPSTFLYQDWGNYHRTVAATKTQYPNFQDPYIDKYGIRACPATGQYLIKYTNGVAIMLSPCFLAAHIYAKTTHHFAANGFSLPYLLAIGWGIIFWVSIGYYYLITVLRRYFSKIIVATVILILAFGTNLLYSTAYNNIMSHPLLFTLWALLIYHTDTYYTTPKLLRLVLVGMTTAMITLIRPNELYCIFIPLLWNVKSVASLKERFQWIFNHYQTYLGASICAFLVFIPQIIYWKALTGSYFYYAYTGETFNFANPHIQNGLIAYYNGWLIWSPVMLIAIIGVFAAKRYAPYALLPVAILLPLHAYVIYSWWCFQYINGFGSRPMQDIYALLAFSMASFLSLIKNRKTLKFIGFAFILACIALNIFQTWQQNKGLIFSEVCNRAFYWSMFGQTKPSQAALIAFATDEIEPQSVTLLDPILKENFEDSTKATNVKLVNQNSFMRCLKAESDTILRCKIPSTEHLNYFNVQLKHLFLPENTIYNYYTLPTLVFQFRDKEGNYLYESTVKPHLLTGNSAYSIWSLGTPNICQAIELNMPIHRRGRATELLIFTDNPARHPSYIDDLIVKTAR